MVDDLCMPVSKQRSVPNAFMNKEDSGKCCDACFAIGLCFQLGSVSVLVSVYLSVCPSASLSQARPDSILLVALAESVDHFQTLNSCVLECVIRIDPARACGSLFFAVTLCMDCVVPFYLGFRCPLAVGWSLSFFLINADVIEHTHTHA